MSADHRPDIFTCLANLRSDEVFTPPKVANDMLDLLPPKMWIDPNLKRLNPASKSGGILRKITRRLMAGLPYWEEAAYQPTGQDLESYIPTTSSKTWYGGLGSQRSAPSYPEEAFTAPSTQTAESRTAR